MFKSIKKNTYTSFFFDYSTSRTVWLNFFKESFLMDYNYKLLYNTLVQNFFVRGGFILNFTVFNKKQILSLHNLQSFIFQSLVLNNSLISFLQLVGQSFLIIFGAVIVFII